MDKRLNNIHVIYTDYCKVDILETGVDHASDFSLRQNVILDCEKISAGGIFLARTIWEGVHPRRVFLISKHRDLIIKYGKGYKGNRSFRKLS